MESKIFIEVYGKPKGLFGYRKKFRNVLSLDIDEKFTFLDNADDISNNLNIESDVIKNMVDMVLEDNKKFFKIKTLYFVFMDESDNFITMCQVKIRKFLLHKQTWYDLKGKGFKYNTENYSIYRDIDEVD